MKDKIEVYLVYINKEIRRNKIHENTHDKYFMLKGTKPYVQGLYDLISY